MVYFCVFCDKKSFLCTKNYYIIYNNIDIVTFYHINIYVSNFLKHNFTLPDTIPFKSTSLPKKGQRLFPSSNYRHSYLKRSNPDDDPFLYISVVTFRYTDGAPLVPARNCRVLVTRSSLPRPRKGWNRRGIEGRKMEAFRNAVRKRRFHAPSSSVLERDTVFSRYDIAIGVRAAGWGTWFSRKKSNFHRPNSLYFTTTPSTPSSHPHLSLPQLFLFIARLISRRSNVSTIGDRVPTSKRGRLIIGLSAFLTPHPPPPPPLRPLPSPRQRPPPIPLATGRLYPGGILFLQFQHDRMSWPGDNWIPFRFKKNPFVKRLLERCVIEGPWLFQVRNRRWEYVDVSKISDGFFPLFFNAFLFPFGLIDNFLYPQIASEENIFENICICSISLLFHLRA